MASITAPGWLAARHLPAVRLDVALVAAALAGTLAQLAHGGLGVRAAEAGVDAAPRLDAVGIVLAACSTLPIVAWRRSPVGAFAVTATASALLAGLGHPLEVALGAAVALYLLAADRRPEPPSAARTTVIVLGLFAVYVSAATPATGAFPRAAALHSGLAWAVAWFAGERTRLRRQHIAELIDRAQRAEREAERERLLAAATERARIARDLHDSAGHAISVIAVRAGAARLHGDPARSHAALEAIEVLARRTAGEIEHIVGTLRDPGTDRAVDAPPGLASVDTLVAWHTAAGLDVTVTTRGASRRLDGPVDQAAYRILQEALTNAARHGTGRAHVDVGFEVDALELTVTNPARGPVAVPGPGRPNGGHGLVGMGERATLLGGSVDSHRTDDSFRVRARLPYTTPRP